jgi:hypothetical protein
VIRFMVTGGRDYTNREYVYRVLDLLTPWPVELIHGNARGLDTLAKEWGEARGVIVTPFPADWDKHGKAAGHIRNQQMVDENPSFVIAFPGGTGTADACKRAQKKGIRVLYASDMIERNQRDG